MYKEHILENNLTVIHERITHLNSVSFGVWIGVGSRNETYRNNGISHLIEHMLFKGTHRRSAKEIAYEFDSIGGEINAFTGKDCTCFYTKTMDSDLEITIDILSDMTLNPLFYQVHIETEKKVIAEEISMYEDDPEERVHDLLAEEMWGEGPLRYPILGTIESLKGLKRDDLFEHMSNYYIPDNCVISVVGNFEEDHLLFLINKYFASWKPSGFCSLSKEQLSFKPQYLFNKKDTEQTHIGIGFQGLPLREKRMYDLLVLNNIIGGGISSRLFQSVREDKGLAYSVYSFPTAFRDCGMFTITAATNPDTTDEAVECICNEIELLLDKGVSEKEIIRSKNQLKGNYILSLDSISGRMITNGKSKLITGEVNSTEEIVKHIESIRKEDVMELLNCIFRNTSPGIVVIGNKSISPQILDIVKF